MSNELEQLLSSCKIAMEKEECCSRELQLLPKTFSSSLPQWTCTDTTTPVKKSIPSVHPSLDLNLSVGATLNSFNHATKEVVLSKNIQALRWHAAEQIRQATLEKAYVERVKELTRREVEMAQEEFARARLVWERTREEVQNVERMKEMATQRVSSTSTEITCRTCRRRFMS
ncbi:C2H2-like zinc fingerprotein [Zostera marina]|uniref:C2H2-like zinc fingerprotein n=1 Tax=Zostera marina TaxID=29655 RepID=A0A0K9Q4L1_ZOSMR|nr:C2H2-like zinc fingerprotein [Zostera marina]